ncbi:MAG TPA: tail fiber protein [Terracidiphilus sp.]|jgi:microcystin-dependent protein
MSEPFLSEIKLISFNFPPKGWAFCNGNTLPINQNQALFSLLGTTYGGNGQTTFQLPNLQGRVPIHMGPGYTLGQQAGELNHTVTIGEMPAHTHPWNVTTTAGNVVDPPGNILGATPLYNATPNALVSMYPGQFSPVGGSQPHSNTQPYLVLNFIIALQGIFPSQN